jgi:Tol biopolymer transport system component/DNA-binding winged helix-turn-helix (wHTH) protein
MGNEVKQLLEFGPFRIDPEQRLLLRDQQPILLSPKTFELLLVLVRHSGRVVLKDDLMKTLWPDTFVEESNLGQHIFQLRRALADKSRDSSQYIVTVPGRGYRFAHPVIAPRPETEPAEDVVIESHTRKRVLVEERVVAAEVDGNPEPAFLLRQRPLMLPTPAVRLQSQGRKIAGLALAAAIGALAVWALLRPAPLPRVLHAIRLTHSGGVEPSGRVLADGPRLYFTERLGGTWRLAQISEQGGDPILISTSVDNIALYDIDQNRSKLLVGAQAPAGDYDDPLWVVGTIGGSAQRVGEVFAGDAAWAPDGHNLAYTHQSELYVASIEGRRSRKLFSTEGTIFSPSWSPDGKSLNFSIRDRGTGVVSIWEIASDGRNPHPLSFGWKNPRSAWGEGECCGAWTPDGRYFVFRSVRENVQSYWMMRQQSGWLRTAWRAPVQIYTTPEGIGEPRFSPDGKNILFVDSQERRELMRYDSARKVFVPFLAGVAARHLSFSRDGRRVAYENESDKSLWCSQTDGSQARRLTFPPLEAMHSTWSPDGKQIVFGADTNLYTIPTDGGEPTLLTAGTQPSWAPDGMKLLLVRNYTEAEGWHPAIYQFDFSTRQVAIIPGSQDFEGPQWSPDGKYAAAANRKDKKLMLFDFARRQWSVLADGLPYGWGIRWSANSQYVYYQHHHGGEEQPIFRVRVSNRQVEPITSSREILRSDLLSYTMTGLAPDDSPLVSLVRRNSDVYALQLEVP